MQNCINDIYDIFNSDYNHRDGLIYSGSLDSSVRVWKTVDCLRSTSLSSSEDPELNFLESKISSARGESLGPGSRSNLRQLSESIVQALALKSVWRTGIISSFFDGINYRADIRNESQPFCVEVVFEDGSVQLISNRLLLRNCDEILLSPTGPPKWNRPEAVPRLGAKVAIFDVDPNTAGLVCSRFLGISSSKSLSYKISSKL